MFTQKPFQPLSAAILVLLVTHAFSLQPSVLGGDDAAKTHSPQASEFNVSIIKNRMAFKTVEDYERVVDNPKTELKNEFIKTINTLTNFNSYSKQLPSSGDRSTRDARSIKDEYFASILNPDLVVQIGGYIFKVNPASEKVYALPVDDEAQYKDLISENTANTKIRVFSTNDDVLDLIRNHGTETRSLFCNQSGIGNKSAGAYINGSNLVTADYTKYGIYFSLVAKIGSIGSWPSLYVFDFTGGKNKGYVHYHVRCGSTSDYSTATQGSWTGTYQKYASYQGSKNLNELYFGFRVKNAGTGQYVTPYVIIRQNW